MARIPFLRPQLVAHAAYGQYLDRIDQAHWYSNFGPLNRLFEQRVVAELFGGVGHVATVANATLGLMLSITASRRPGRYAVMPSFTFAATALAARWCGLEPWFVDVDAKDWCSPAESIQSVLDRLGDEVAVVVLYPTFGTCVDLGPYSDMVRQGTPIVVDAAPGLGAHRAGIQFGQGFPGPVVFSLHATKPFGVGEAGLVYSADRELIERIRRLSNFGFDDARESVGRGINAKLPEYTAAVALATLDQYPAKLRELGRLRRLYQSALEEGGVLRRGFTQQNVAGDVPLQFLSLCAPSARARVEIVERLAQADIESRTYFAPACHQQKEFAGCPREGLAVTDDLTTRILSLPAWVGMEDESVQSVVRVLVSL